MAEARHTQPAGAESRLVGEFGEQWERFRDTSGYFGSLSMLRDFLGPLLAPEDLADRRVLDVGSGAGRFANMFLDAGASRVLAVEPSEGIDVLKDNTRERADRMEYLNVRGEEIPDVEADVAFSIGVLHHLEDPDPVVRRVRQVLRPGGRFVVWLYGRENNTMYILFAESIRLLTRAVPDAVLEAMAHVLNAILGVYVAACRILPLPLRTYMLEVMSRMDRRKRFFLIFDQLNCSYARYYTGEEAVALLERNGFCDVQAYHRHGMSWTVMGAKPTEGPPC